MPDRAQVSRHLAVRSGIGDLHPPATAPATHQALQQRMAVAGGATALTARSHVGLEPGARGEILIPGRIAGMVLGQADRPLLDWQLDRLDLDSALGVEAFLL